MKTLKITTDNKISIIDVDLDDYRVLQQEIGGYVETVHTQIMYDYFRAPVGKAGESSTTRRIKIILRVMMRVWFVSISSGLQKLVRVSR